MRRLLIALGALAAMTIAAPADQIEGKITAIDAEKQTITLEDGKTYRLPAEFDASAIEEGQTILFAYDVVGGVNLITDIALE